MKSIYNLLPALLQDAAVSSVGLSQKIKRYDKYYYQSLNSYLERDQWSQDRILAYQREQIRCALERASNTDYYSDIFKSMGAHWSDLCDYKNFKLIPITYKDDVTKNPDLFKTRDEIRSDIVVSTSGTTGKSLKFNASKKFDSDQWAVWWRYRARFGIKQWTKCSLFSSTPIIPPQEKTRFYRANLAYDEYRFSVFHISDNTVESYVRSLNSIKAPWIHGNPSGLAILAKLMLEKKLTLNHEVKWLTIGSENLQPWQEEVLLKAFGTKPIQHYGLMEGVSNISQCPSGNLHTDEDFSFTEFVEQDGTESKLILGTSFCNDAFSLLRYSTSDLATLDETACLCGRPGRIVASIDGRSTDYITLPSGERIASLAGPFHSTAGLSEAQIYQDESGGLTVRYVPNDDWDDANIKTLESKLFDRIGMVIPIRFQQVERVERTARGKVKLVISDYASN